MTPEKFTFYAGEKFRLVGHVVNGCAHPGVQIKSCGKWVTVEPPEVNHAIIVNAVAHMLQDFLRLSPMYVEFDEPLLKVGEYPEP